MTLFAWSTYDCHPFTRDSHLQSRLDINGSRRVNALPWRGQFSPELAEFLIQEFHEPGMIIDPFCGSGTTLVEAGLLGHPSVGTEVNPAAYLLARVYELLPLGQHDRAALATELVEQAQQLDGEGATFETVAQWAIDAKSMPEKILRDAAFLLASGNSSSLKPGKLKYAAKQIRNLLVSLPEAPSEVSVRLGDARRLDLADGCASGMLTSPPYINVFNYHQNYRSAVEALGWEVLGSARAEFGSNRKHRQNRFLTVIQYAQDIAETIQEMVRVLRPGANAIWVVGRESRVLGVPIPNPLIVFEVATSGFGLELIQKYERSFTSRYGPRVFEDVLVFRHPRDTSSASGVDATELGQDVGVNVLTSLLPISGNAESSVRGAIEGASHVRPSPAPTFSLFGDVPPGPSAWPPKPLQAEVLG